MKKDIKDAIKEHLRAKAFVADPNNLGFVDRFLEHTKAAEWGAEWRINSVWHNSKTEVPDVNTIVLVEKEDGSIWQYKVFAKSQMLGWKRWAYIKDLIPNE